VPSPPIYNDLLGKYHWCSHLLHCGGDSLGHRTPLHACSIKRPRFPEEQKSGSYTIRSESTPCSPEDDVHMENISEDNDSASNSASHFTSHSLKTNAVVVSAGLDPSSNNSFEDLASRSFEPQHLLNLRQTPPPPGQKNLKVWQPAGFTFGSLPKSGALLALLLQHLPVTYPQAPTFSVISFLFAPQASRSTWR
jgi:hypothetical protein